MSETPTGTPTEEIPSLGDAPTVETPRLGEAATIAAREAAPPPPPEEEVKEPSEVGAREIERPPASPLRSTIAAVLGSAAAAWMMAGPFAGPLPKIVSLGGVVLGGALIALSYRSRRPTPIQLMAIPAALVFGGALIVPTGADPARLIDLVVESLRSGGLAVPPVPFDPGWRVVIVLISTWLTVTAATTAVALDRPRLGVMVPGVVALIALLFQPPEQEVVGVIVALVLSVAGLAVGYGADLAREGTAGATFELRRLLRAGGMATLLIVVMVAVGQLGFLLPETTIEQVIPPKRPEIAPPPRDRVMFTVASEEEQVPWRVGVLDVYQDNAWMTPPFDPGLLVDFEGGSGTIAQEVTPELMQPGAVIESEETYEATFTLEDVEGRVVPLLPGVVGIDGELSGLQYDPRTQTLRVDGRQPQGTNYTIAAAVPPDGEALASASRAPVDVDALEEFLRASEPGPIAEALVEEALALDATRFEKLQHVRDKLYKEVIAAGQGDPVDVPAVRVDQMLEGGEATPYEIVNAEALLARWVGVPARLGYGYYGGDERDGVREIRPEHGAMWLEVYFDTLGWVPIVGRPPKAQASLSEDEKNEDPSLIPTDEIAAQVFVPTLGTTLAPVYLLVRYWLVRVLPLVIGVVVLIGGYPALLKRFRRWRRRRWADKLGPRARIAVAYAEVRDLANDLNIGHPTLTPIEFLDAVEPDAEHRELAWLVTRTMWGDLRRDARDTDATAAEELARSFRKRLSGGQPYVMRVLATISRVSLRQPFDIALPNLWWSKRKQQAAPLTSAAGRARALGARVRAAFRPVRRGLARVGRFVLAFRALLGRLRRRLPRPVAWLFSWRLPRPRLRFVVPVVTVALVAGGILLIGVKQVDLSTAATFEVPEVPEEIEDYRFEHYAKAQQAYEAFGPTSLLNGGTFYGIRHQGVIVGSLQQSAFKAGPRLRGQELHDGLLASLLMGPDDLIRLGGERVYVRRVPEQTQYLWLAPDLSDFQLMIATRDLKNADAVFAALLAIQRGESVTELEPPADRPPLDPRRGIP